jgi:hypothetical protein
MYPSMMFYNNETLNKYCLTNDIQLVDDYTNVKMNREGYIKGSKLIIN